jgi:uncharacterized protein (DUF1697 family)
MSCHIVLLRGINLGSRNRIAMPELRELLASAGFGEVRTHLQSGNVVLTSNATPHQIGRMCEAEIAEQLQLEIEAVVRTRDELAEVVQRNPFGQVATNPKRYQVCFLACAPDLAAVEKLEAATVAPEQFKVVGREIYTWHPEGIGRSRLSAQLTSPRLGVTATARNWSTVTSLLALADD